MINSRWRYLLTPSDVNLLRNKSEATLDKNLKKYSDSASLLFNIDCLNVKKAATTTTTKSCFKDISQGGAVWIQSHTKKVFVVLKCEKWWTRRAVCALKELNLQFRGPWEANRQQEAQSGPERALDSSSQSCPFFSHTYLPVRCSSGPPCPPCASDSPRSVTPLGTGGIFRFSCVVEITVSQQCCWTRTWM